VPNLVGTATPDDHYAVFSFSAIRHFCANI
jgi:hypothetical protein